MSEESRKHNSHAAESWRELAGDVRQWAEVIDWPSLPRWRWWC